MKTTVYFTSSSDRNFQWNECHLAVQSVADLRDAFLQKNDKIIGKIDEEDIKIISVANHQQIVAIIKLSYYPK